MFASILRAVGFVVVVSIVGAVLASMGKPPVKIIELQGDAWMCTKSRIIHHEALSLGTSHGPEYDEERCDAYARK